MKILEYMERYDYEQLVFCQDRGAGLKAIIAIHDTTLGPALGGARMWPYPSEGEAILDALRLGRAMTYKAAAAGLPLGGGKAVIIGNAATDKTEALFRSLGRYVEALGGRYITTEDVGTSVSDITWVRQETTHAAGLPVSAGSSGDPSPSTALGVYCGMQACAEEVWGSDSLRGKTVAIQGLGKVGYALARLLQESRANLIVTDVNEKVAQRAKKELGATLTSIDGIYDAECDFFSPCALGAVLSEKTIPRLKCRVVAGCANNQLQHEEDGEELARRGILYAPDYIINAGGLINISVELEHTGYNPAEAEAKVRAIHNTVARVIALAKAEGISMARAADRLAEQRISAVRAIRKLYL